TGKERGAFPGWASPMSLVLSPDGRTVARRGKTIALVETATGGQRAELAGHEGMLFDATFAPDGRTLASAGVDGTGRLWGGRAGKETAKREGHRGWVWAAPFAPDGTTLVSGGIDTTALVWDGGRFTARRVKAVATTPAELEACWKDLAADAPVAYAAIGKL